MREVEADGEVRLTVLPLAGRAGRLVFEAEGFRLLGARRRRRLHRYADITHLWLSQRGLVIGLVEEFVAIRRRDLVSAEDGPRLVRALRERIAALPEGALALGRMAEIDALMARPRRRRAVPGLMVLCVLGSGLQIFDPFVTQVGSMIPPLALAGETWRFFTAHLLHDLVLLPIHLGLNLLCLLVFGSLVERVLGAPRTLLVMGTAASLSMWACTVAGYSEVIGASGIAAGLAGALLCLELQHGRRLPAPWRLPRRLFIGALVGQLVIDLSVPMIATAAHLAGFAAGYLTTRPLAGLTLQRRREGGVERALALAVVGVMLVSVLAAAPLALRDPEALQRHALRLLHVTGTPPNHDNDLAWLIVTESTPTPTGVQLAVALAERAVARSGRQDPDVLDTLAEALFVAGERADALAVIDEAIALSDGEEYFVEQRRRFRGQRARDDRPEPPDLPWRLRRRERGLLVPGAPAIPL